MGRKSLHKADSKLEVFARQYVLLNFNGTQAAIAAGYSKKTAPFQASRLLKNRKVQAALARFKAAADKKLDFSVNRVLEELARVAMVDRREIQWPDGRLKEPREMDADLGACIAGIEMAGTANKQRIKSIKLADKLRALDMLARYHKLFAEDRTPSDLGVKVIVLDMPRPIRNVTPAQLPANGGHKNGHKPTE